MQNNIYIHISDICTYFAIYFLKIYIICVHFKGKSCGGSHKTVKEIYNYYKANNFTRGTFNTGDSLNIDEGFLVYANSAIFNQPNDPYRFKLVLSWTHNTEKEMDKFVNPNKEWQTDGQIFGNWIAQWNNDQKYAKQWFNVLKKYPTEVFATSDDDPFHEYNRRKPDFIAIDPETFNMTGIYIAISMFIYSYIIFIFIFTSYYILYIDNISGNVTVLVNTTKISNTSYIALKSIDNEKYIRVYPNGTMKVSSSTLTVNESFTRFEISNGNNFFVSYWKTFLTANNDSTFSVEATDEYQNSAAWKWTVVDMGNDIIALYHGGYVGGYGGYLSMDIDGNLYADADNVTFSEMFEIVDVPFRGLIYMYIDIFNFYFNISFIIIYQS